METVTRQEQTEARPPLDSDREELQSALNRMMEAAGSWKRERAQLAAACDQLRRQLNERGDSAAVSELGRTQLVAECEELRMRINGTEEAAAAWEGERAQLLAECGQLRQQVSDTEAAAALALERQVASAVERMRFELLEEGEKLRAELQRLTEQASEGDVERKRLTAELEDTRQLLADTEQAAAIALERQVATAVEQARIEFAAEGERLQQEILRMQAERGLREETASETEQRIADAVERVRSEMTGERDRLRQDLDAAMQLCAQRGADCTQLASERDSARREIAAAAEQARAEFEGEKARLRSETDAERVRLSAELDRAKTLLSDVQASQTTAQSKFEEAEKKKRELLNECDRLRQELGRLSEAEAERGKLRAELERVNTLLIQAEASQSPALAEIEAAERKNSELIAERDRLRQQVEQLSDAAAQKELERSRLKEECDRANQLLEELTAPGQSTPSEGVVAAVNAEAARVEGLVHELSTLIDDPATELAVVIRKTVERAQLEFYLKGLRFLMTGE